MTYKKSFENGNPIDSYIACGYVEGFVETENENDILRAWGYLIGTGQCWSLQGWYGRTATNLIENGIIDNNGVIL